MGQPMLLRSVRSRLLGLVVATVIPFTALIGAGLWNQWQHDEGRAIEGAVNQARLLAAQIAAARTGETTITMLHVSIMVTPSAV